MRKLKVCFLLALAAGLVSVIGCKKSYNTTVVGGKDSIYYSPWITLSMGFSQVDPTFGDSAYEQIITAKKVTQSIISHGVVLTYIIQGLTNNGDTVISNAESILNPFLYVNSIDLYTGAYGDLSGVPFRYVIIPGNVLTTTVFKDYSSAQLKKLSYTEVNGLLKAAATKTETPGQLNSPQ